MAEANTESLELAGELAGLTERQQRGLVDLLDEVRSSDGWSWQLPVLLQERCWLRLSRTPLTELHRLLPPDGRDEAPELMHYRRLLEQGVDPLLAQQSCWQDFGMEDCQRALQDYWSSRDSANHGWTAQRYRQLVSGYLSEESPLFPVLVLARKNSVECRQLIWISASDASHLRLIPGHGS